MRLEENPLEEYQRLTRPLIDPEEETLKRGIKAIKHVLNEAEQAKNIIQGLKQTIVQYDISDDLTL